MSVNGYVYLMYDTSDYKSTAPVYIGSTKSGDIGKSNSRIYQHFHTLKNGKMTKEEYDSIQCIRIAQVPTLADARLLERYLIGKYLPTGKLYNTQFTKEGIPTVFIDTSWLDFKTFQRADFLPQTNNLAETTQTPSHAAHHKKRNCLRLLDKCYLIENTGSSHILYYARSKKEIMFLDTSEYADISGYLEDDIDVFPNKDADVFYSAAEWLGIPEDDGTRISSIDSRNKDAYEYFVQKGYLQSGQYPITNISFTLSDILAHPEYDKWFPYCDMQERKKFRQEIIDYKNTYTGLPDMDFFAVWNNDLSGSGYSSKNFSTKEEAIEYANRASTTNLRYKVTHITNESHEIIYVSNYKNSTTSPV